MAVLQHLGGAEATGGFQQCFQFLHGFVGCSLFFCEAVGVQANQHRPLLLLVFCFKSHVALHFPVCAGKRRTKIPVVRGRYIEKARTTLP